MNLLRALFDPDVAKMKLAETYFAKSLEWEYEQEWRVLRTGGGSGAAEQSAGMLARVILGCEIRASDREEIVAVVSGLADAPELRQARRSPSEFALEFREIRVTEAAV